MQGTGIGEEFRDMVMSFFNGKHTRTINIDADHSSDTLESILSRMYVSGWQILSVSVETNCDTESVQVSDFMALAALADALITEPEHAGTILAYGELNGFNVAEYWEHTRYGRKFLQEFMGVYGSDMARTLVEEFISNDELELPIWLSVDYEATARDILTDFNHTDLRGQTYVFVNA